MIYPKYLLRSLQLGMVLAVVALPQVTLATYSITEGVALTGAVASDAAGTAVASAGDVNGDGFRDLLVTAPMNATAGSAAGAVYLIYGSNDVLSSTASLTTVADAIFTGVTASDQAGVAVAGAGDVDGDGYDDFLVGSSNNTSSTGVVYLVYGDSAEFTGTLSLGTAGVAFTGESSGGQAGAAVAGAGDVNGDGRDDFIIGAPALTTNTGAAYVVLGKAQHYTATALTSSSSIIKLTGEATSNFAGSAVASAGDVNNDGFADLLVGAYGYSSNGGAAYLIYGSGSLASTTLGSGSQVRYTNVIPSALNGAAVASAGDVNNDGFSDFLIGAYNGGGTNGATYLIYGRSIALTGVVLSSGTATEILGAVSQDRFGRTLAGAGDVNGDGYDDFLVAATQNDDGFSEAGTVYLILGQTAAISSFTISTSSTNPIVIEFTGEAAGDGLGNAMATAGDYNADGYPDVIVGASANDTTASAAGAAYLLFMYTDDDGDGEGATDAIFPGTDCNDSDADVTTEQTYYQDDDGDGLGVDDTTTLVCSATAPDGFTDNTNDTDDTIKNNGIEIGNDDVDNDADGLIDEVNTIADGAHPEFGVYDPNDTADYSAAVLSIEGDTDGTIRVTFADQSVYQYTVFTVTTTKDTQVKSYKGTGYLVVLHPQGKKLALVNVYTGEVLSTVTLGATSYSKINLKLLDARSDGSIEAVITTQKNSTGYVAVVKVKQATERLKKKEVEAYTGPAAVSKTKVVKKKLLLRRKSGKTLETYKVNKKYHLVLQF